MRCKYFQMTKKDFHITILVFSVALLIQLILIVVFAILQVSIDPRDHPQEFSIITGGDKQIRHLGEICDNIELDSFTPNIRTTAYIYRSRSRDSMTSNKNLERIFMNNILEVGYSSSQLTYYGVPVSRNDEIKFNISSSNRSPNSLSVVISVYEVEGFSQLLEYLSQNVNPRSHYNLHSCLLTTGCVVNLEAEFDGWLYVVFDSTPTPSTLNVSLEATVREYDIDLIDITSKCVLSEISPRCNLEVPTRVYDDFFDDEIDVSDLPFFIIYNTASLFNSPPPSQSLNVSVDLTSTCTRTYFYTYVILSSILGVTSIISAVVLISLVWENFERPIPPSMNCCKNTHPRRNHSRTTDTELTQVRQESIRSSPSSSSTIEKSYDMNEPVPSYEKAIGTVIEPEDEPPYYKK